MFCNCCADIAHGWPSPLLLLLIGDSNCFLFSVVPRMEVYMYSGYNDHYMYLNAGQQTMPNGLVSTTSRVTVHLVMHVWCYSCGALWQCGPLMWCSCVSVMLFGIHAVLMWCSYMTHFDSVWHLCGAHVMQHAICVVLVWLSVVPAWNGACTSLCSSDAVLKFVNLVVLSFYSPLSAASM